MAGTVMLVLVFMLTALVVVLYAAYCEAGDDLPCKKAQKRSGISSPVTGGTERKGRS